MKAKLGLCTIILACALQTFAQGTFINLGFESAVIIPVPGDPYSRVQFTEALPGWIGTINGSLETRALYNKMFLDSGGIGIQGPGSGATLSGSYTAMLQSGYALTGPPALAISSLSQTGMVPGDARSLKFKVAAYGPFQVLMNDQALSLTPLLVTSSYTVYGANIEAFAGASSKLTFTVNPKQNPPVISTVLFDDIEFSVQSVPEPGTFSLLGVGGLLLASRMRRSLGA